MATRWISLSIYLPPDFELAGGASWGPVLFGSKARNESASSGMNNIHIEDGSWVFIHRWSDILNQPASGENLPWWQVMKYSSSTPSANEWPDGILDYPDAAASRAALADLNLGGWTDWVMKIRYDARGSGDGGTGFMDVWKRAGDGPWVHVLHIVPRVVERSGRVFDRGIGYNSPPTSSNNGGFCMTWGLYGDKEAFWNAPRNVVVHMDNIKIGDENATFAEMSPDGSSPGGAGTPVAPPASPGLQPVE
jgi:hypothetical protein